MSIYLQAKPRPARELPMTEAEREARIQLAFWMACASRRSVMFFFAG